MQSSGYLGSSLKVVRVFSTLTHAFLVLSDVNFIASPPSMVAAGSVVAAVQGLYLKNQDASLSSQNLTNFLSQVIRSDPVCNNHFSKPWFECGKNHWLIFNSVIVCNGVYSLNCVLAGLFAGMSGADRVTAGVKPAAGSAAQRFNRTQMCWRGCGPVLHPNRCERH